MRLSNNAYVQIALIVAALVVMALLSMVVHSQPAAAIGEPPAGSVSGYVSYTLYPETALTGSDTVYSASPRTFAGEDVSNVAEFNSVDVCTTVDIATTGTITVTPQFTNFGDNRATNRYWADASYDYWTGSAVSAQDYQTELTADGADCIRVPVIGEYLRLKVEHTDAMTPTIRVTLRNNGGVAER
jgi:hypothetical protein